MNGFKKSGKWEYMREVQRAKTHKKKREQTEVQNICTAAEST